MKALLAASELKIFARALRFLARINNNIYLEGTTDGLILRVANESASAFCTITLLKNFFANYQMTGSDDQDNYCRISSRPLLHIFKNIKNVISCQLQFNLDKNRLMVYITRPKDVEIQYIVSILELEKLEGYEPSNDAFSSVACQPTILSNLLDNIPKNLRDLSLDFSKTRLEIRNHISHPDQDVQTVRLNFKLDPVEFTSYDVAADTRLIIFSQDLLLIVDLAEKSAKELQITFTSAGKPMIASFESDDSMQVQMVMATMREEDLKLLRKPSGVTSYKALIGSFIEGRMKLHANDSNDLGRNLSETELRYEMSPPVGSFQTNMLRASGPSVDAKLSKSKRKSTETPMDVDDVPQPPVQPKKQRKSVELSQKEQEELSKTLIFLDSSETNDDVLPNPSEVSPNVNLFIGIEGKHIQVRLRQTVFESSEMAQESESVRFEMDKVILPSEEVISATPSNNHKTGSQNSKTKKTNLNTLKHFKAQKHEIGRKVNVEVMETDDQA